MIPLRTLRSERLRSPSQLRRMKLKNLNWIQSLFLDRLDLGPVVVRNVFRVVVRGHAIVANVGHPDVTVAAAKEGQIVKVLVVGVEGVVM